MTTAICVFRAEVLGTYELTALVETGRGVHGATWLASLDKLMLSRFKESPISNNKAENWRDGLAIKRTSQVLGLVPSSRESNTLFWFPQTLQRRAHTGENKHTNIHINKNTCVHT